MLKKIILCGFVIIGILHVTAVLPAEDPIIDNTITPFFEALKNGDVKTIETYIDEPLYSQIKVLLTKNQKYPEYLRKYYTDTYVDVTGIKDLTDKKKDVNVEIHFPDNYIEAIILHLSQVSTGEWKITEQTVITN